MESGSSYRSSLPLVICTDLKSCGKDPAQYWKNAPKKSQEFLVSAMKKFYKNNKEL